MAISRADLGEKHAVEYQEGARKAREARAHVATQLGELINKSDITGSHAFVAKRIQGYSAALKSGDLLIIRSALMELGAAVGVTAVSIDLATTAQNVA